MYYDLYIFSNSSTGICQMKTGILYSILVSIDAIRLPINIIVHRKVNAHDRDFRDEVKKAKRARQSEPDGYG